MWLLFLLTYLYVVMSIIVYFICYSIILYILFVIVYCSWGPEDDGKTVDGPHHLANLALRHGVDFGRQGYGSIYVVASGNGGSSGDNCNYDGYANSIFTITIGAVDESGHMPYYGEECASMLSVTFSSGSSFMRSIVRV